MNFNTALRVLVGMLVASSTVESFAPSRSTPASARRIPSRSRTDTTVAYVDTEKVIFDLPGACNVETGSCNAAPVHTETLDAEMDTFADPNDKRYGASDWAHNIVSLPNSSILRDVRSPVGWISGWATLVSVVYTVCNVAGFGGFASKMCLGTTPHSLIASSIGLLLVFRTNSAYQRFAVSCNINHCTSTVTCIG